MISQLHKMLTYAPNIKSHMSYQGYIYYLLSVAYTLLYFVFIAIVYASIVLVLLIFYFIHSARG